MINQPFIWIDCRQRPGEAGLFETIPASYNAHKITHTSDIPRALLINKPRFLCFEFDIPQSSDLNVLQQTKQLHPALPLLMVTEPHSETLAVWAFRSGVWDYLIKPLTHDYLLSNINRLLEACYFSYESENRLLPSAPLLSEKSTINVFPNRFHKTLPAIEFVKINYAKTIRLSHIAALCNLSNSTFCRTFKQEHHTTFSDYLMSLRINKACEILADPRIQIKQAAFDVGFNDLSYFSRIFRRYMGITPSEYQTHRHPHLFFPSQMCLSQAS